MDIIPAKAREKNKGKNELKILKMNFVRKITGIVSRLRYNVVLR